MSCEVTRRKIIRAKIASKLKRMRIESKLSQREAAELAGVKQGHVSIIESNKISPKIETLALFLDVYKTNLNDFFSDIKY